MKEIEILGLIIMSYDYNPKPSEINVYYEYMAGGAKHFPIWFVVKVGNYLKRKGYYSKDGQPTLKFYKLLAKYNIKIKPLKEWQDEYAATGHVTQYDKLGNKHRL